ncbi:hypothetical protein [Sediminibacillus massiliensis]|uniref:hypothetical protein n=1 Tax=Sediminibacillus massiliensis TaxID=1926277 RepID=UPI000988759F|nr:hypothetical protein [Sediminibacillus massiliensis]
MLKRFLVVIKVSKGTYRQKEVRTLDSEKDLRELIGSIVTSSPNALEDTRELISIFEVDLIYGKIKELEPVLRDMKLVLKEKK